VYTLLESINEFICDDKIEFINVAFLLKDASIEVVFAGNYPKGYLLRHGIGCLRKSE
jgi:hypothetical protein